MPLWRDDPPPSVTSIAALCALTVAAVASLGRVFDGPGYLLWAVPAVLIGAGSVLAFRKSLGRTFALLVLAGGVTLPTLFAHKTTDTFLPTREGFRVVRELFGAGLSSVSSVATPVAAQPRYTILVWCAFLLLGFLGAAWVVVRRPVGAVVSALGVIAFSGGIGTGPGRDGYAVAAVALAGAFFLSEGRQRISRWGRTRVPSWFGLPTLAAASAFAAVAPLIFGAGPLINLRTTLRPRLVIIKPLSDIQKQLKVDPPIELLRVSADRPTYWRLTALDAYDGKEWVLRARPRPLVKGRVPPAEPPTTGDVLQQRYRLTGLLAPWMPAAYAVVSVDSGPDVEMDSPSQTLYLPGRTSPGLEYSVSSRLPSGAQNIDGPRFGGFGEDAESFGDLATPLVGNAKTPLDKALRLERHFRTYTYDEDVEGTHTVERLQRFLADKRGYCEQFAAAMTLMLRGLGVDARVGVGFLPGALIGGEYVVSTRELHAWVEADIPGAGWMTFDPTPGRGEPAGSPSVPEPQEAQAPPPLATAVPQSTPVTEDVRDADQARGFPIGRAAPYAGALLALITPAAAKRLRRSRRRASPPPQSVLGAFAELTDRAADLGWSTRPSETQREFCRRLFSGQEEAATSLVEPAMRALFAPSPVSRADAQAAWRSVPETLSTLRKRAPKWRRVMAFFDPRTLMPKQLLSRLRPTRLRPRAVG